MEVMCCRDGKLVWRGRMGMDTVCAVMDGDGLIFHYRAALKFEFIFCFAVFVFSAALVWRSDAQFAVAEWCEDMLIVHAQGHSRRILVSIEPVHNSGTLPIICESISQVSIGCVCARSKLQKGLDSYQEEDLSILRDKWSDVLAKRRDYLDDQLQKIMSKEGLNGLTCARK